ncbi:MAG: hypothetical protein AAF674_22615 [Pseudomonadota bacterium]
MSGQSNHTDAVIDKAFEDMVARGLMKRVDGGYQITDAGRRYLAERRNDIRNEAD